MPFDTTLNELEYAGAMKFRFLDVSITDYTNGGEPFVPNDANLNRFQFVAANVDGSGGHANFDGDNQQIRVYDNTGAELADAATAELTVVAIGR